MTVSLQDNTDAQKLGTRSLTCAYQKMENENKPGNDITKD